MRTEYNEKLDSILQEIRGKETQTNVPTAEVPEEHQDQDEQQDQDEHQDQDEQAWMQDEMNRRTRTEQFPPTSNVTDIHAIE